MISQVQNYIESTDKNKDFCLSDVIKYISDNFPRAKESFKNKMPAYQAGDVYVSFGCENNVFSLFSNFENSLELIKTLIPSAELKKGCVSASFSEQYLFHAVKIAVDHAFNPNIVTYKNIIKAEFISRPNRFIANIKIGGKEHICHVKNTGRCSELLLPGAEIYVQQHNNPKRKTQYSLISVVKENRLINIDSQVPNKAVHKWLLENNLFGDIEYIKPEYNYRSSRIDFFIQTKSKKILLEVKGVTLEENGIAMFPDAPTLRGINHINELINAKKEGYASYILFVIQMPAVRFFTPNYATHPEFGKALKSAKREGVKILAYDCITTKDSIAINSFCPVML